MVKMRDSFFFSFISFVIPRSLLRGILGSPWVGDRDLVGVSVMDLALERAVSLHLPELGESPSSVGSNIADARAIWAKGGLPFLNARGVGEVYLGPIWTSAPDVALMSPHQGPIWGD